MSKNILVTGGCGFIGSHFIRYLLDRDKKCTVFNLDCLAYAADVNRVKDIRDNKRYKFIKADIRKQNNIKKVFSHGIDEVIHFAAESHVDNSIVYPCLFEEVNVRGTLNLLQVSREHKVKKFIYVSTDEVYGDIKKGSFNEDSPLAPSSPYSASKAAGEFFLKAYARTYSFPGIIVRCSNNYGSWQHKEKFIPVVIKSALKNKAIPIYSKGQNVREWIYVQDCVEAIYAVMKKAKKGEVFNIGSGLERRNIDVARSILDILGKSKSLISFVPDRLGHDFRYKLNSNKIRKSLQWRPKVSFTKGLEMTCQWYI